jgi:hypothetical protein
VGAMNARRAVFLAAALDAAAAATLWLPWSRVPQLSDGLDTKSGV